MLPSIKHKEWLQLVMGTLDPPIASHLFKIKLNTLRQKVRRKMTNPRDAAKELYEDCRIHEDIYKKDLHHIFKTQKNTSS